MIRPNELAAPGERAAYARLEELFERLDEASFDPMLPAPGVEDPPDDRDELLAEVEDLADRRGLGELLQGARDEVESALLARMRGPGGYPIGVAITSGARPDDEARLVVAIMDAVAVAVVQDVLDRATAQALAGPAWRLLGMAPLGVAPAGGGPEPTDASGATGADDSTGVTDATGGQDDPHLLGAPTARDWAEADRGATAIEPGETPRARREARTAVAVVAAVFGAPTAFMAATGTGGPLLGVLAAVAVVAVCWTVATAGRR